MKYQIFNVEKAEKFLPLLKKMKVILITVPENCLEKEYLTNIVNKIEGFIENDCKLISMALWNENNGEGRNKIYANFNKKNFIEVKELLLNISDTINSLKPKSDEYIHKPNVINQGKLYSYFPKTNTIKVLNEEVIRIAKGSNLNKPETQFQFHNVLNKKGFFQQIQNDGIKKGATIKFEDIELEYK